MIEDMTEEGFQASMEEFNRLSEKDLEQAGEYAIQEFSPDFIAALIHAAIEGCLLRKAVNNLMLSVVEARGEG